MKNWMMIIAMVVCAAVTGKMALAEGTLAGGNGEAGQRNQGRRGERFAKWDTNGDEKISFDEFKAGVEARIARRQSEGKANGNGQPDEQRMRGRFDRMDADKDGFLSRAEIVAAVKTWKAHRRNGGN